MSTKEQIITVLDFMSEEQLLVVLNNLKQTYVISQKEDVPNAETLEAIKEVEDMQKNPHLYKSYTCFSEILEELENEV